MFVNAKSTMAPMVQLAGASWLSILTASLAVVLAWHIWSSIRKRVLYDLHRIPGPRALPLIGNLHQVIGTDMYHKVREMLMSSCGLQILLIVSSCVHLAPQKGSEGKHTLGLHVLVLIQLEICAESAALDDAVRRHSQAALVERRCTGR